jgi:hypothetical protein
VLETPSHPAAAGGKLFHQPQNAASNFIRPASGLRGGDAFPYSSQRFSIGAETVTDIKSSAPYCLDLSV